MEDLAAALEVTSENLGLGIGSSAQLTCWSTTRVVQSRSLLQ